MSQITASQDPSTPRPLVARQTRERSAMAFDLAPFPDPALHDAIDRFVRDIGGPLAVMRSGPEPAPEALARGAALSLADLFAEAGQDGMPSLTAAVLLVLPVASADPALFLALTAGCGRDFSNIARDSARDDPDAIALRLCTGLAGAARAAERTAHAYARLRRSGDAPIWHYQAVARRLADAVIAADAAELSLLEFASHLEGAIEWPRRSDVPAQRGAGGPAGLAAHIIACADVAIEETFMVQAGHGYTMESVPARLRALTDPVELAVRRLLEIKPKSIRAGRAWEAVNG